MLNQSEESAGSSTVPRPELNPLLNPLLAENMKRWAEVYFSVAPERRDEAVQALLEELRAKQSTALTAERSMPHVPERHNPTSVSSQPDTIRCMQCGQENPRQYQFCGNCGQELVEAPLVGETETNEIRPSEWQRWEDPEYSKHDVAEPDDGKAPSCASPGYQGLSILQGGTEAEHTNAESDVPNFMYEPEPSHHYRVYIGLFLAIMIGGLGYKAWKVTKGAENTYAPTPPPVSAEDSDAPANAPEIASAAQNTASDAAAKPTTPATADTNVASRKDAPVGSAPAKSAMAEDGTADVNQPAASRDKASAAAQALSNTPAANGSDELSRAQQYLNGRNSAQAAPWLWKSVSKHNGQATLLLADLYLKGDGVSKNCDQARVLLDSAARKGVAGAGERLRHLSAFGCQ